MPVVTQKHRFRIQTEEDSPYYNGGMLEWYTGLP